MAKASPRVAAELATAPCEGRYMLVNFAACHALLQRSRLATTLFKSNLTVWPLSIAANKENRSASAPTAGIPWGRCHDSDAGVMRTYFRIKSYKVRRACGKSRRMDFEARDICTNTHRHRALNRLVT